MRIQKNNALFAIGLMIVSCHAFSQTVDQFSSSRRQPVVPAQNFTLQSATVEPEKKETPPPETTKKKKGLLLVGIYSSKDRSEAEFEVNGITRYFSTGDYLPGEWRIERITATAVYVKKCDEDKQCEKKRIHLSGE